MTQKEIDVMLCRGVAVTVFTLLTVLEAAAILLLFGHINIFTGGGMVAFLKVFTVANLINAGVFFFAIRYQRAKSISAGMCRGQCIAGSLPTNKRKLNDPTEP